MRKTREPWQIAKDAMTIWLGDFPVQKVFDLMAEAHDALRDLPHDTRNSILMLIADSLRFNASGKVASIMTEAEASIHLERAQNLIDEHEGRISV